MWAAYEKVTVMRRASEEGGLGVLGLVVILMYRGAVISHNEINYRNPWWRLSCWGFGVSLLVGLVLVRIYCGRLFNYVEEGKGKR